MPRYRVTGLTDLKLLKSSGGGSPTVVKTDVHFAQTVEFSPIEEELEYDGDGQLVKNFYMSGLDVEITADTYDLDAIATITGSTVVTTVSGVAKRYYFGTVNDQSGVTCGIEATIIATDITTGDNKTVRVVCPLGRLGLINPPNANSRQKSQLTLKFSAEKTDEDIAGTALTGVPTGGAFWYIEEMA